MIEETHLNGIAQDLGVIQSEGGDSTDRRTWYAIGGIQAATQAHLQNSHIQLFLGEHLQA